MKEKKRERINKGGKEKMPEIVATNAVASRPPECQLTRTPLLAKSNLAAMGPQSGLWDLERCLSLDFWAVLSTFAK